MNGYDLCTAIVTILGVIFYSLAFWLDDGIFLIIGGVFFLFGSIIAIIGNKKERLETSDAAQAHLGFEPDYTGYTVKKAPQLPVRQFYQGKRDIQV